MLSSKFKSQDELARIRGELDSTGKKLVFTNGCFDLLHVGHVRYLKAAKKQGDALAVAVNGDASVRSLKGAGRPINPETERAEVLSALECVNYVTIFPDIRVTKLLRAVRPHIYVKGGDYSVESLDADERAALEDAGSKIEILPLVPNKSTTSLIEKMNEENRNAGTNSS